MTNVGRLPKAELHCHLDGVPDPAMLRVLRDEGIELALTPEAFEAAYPVHDFESFFACFEAQRPQKGSFDLYGHIARLHVEQLKAQHVVYASVSTDDPGAFGCSMSSEYALLAERFGFTADELITLGANAVRARFQPELRMAGARSLALA